MKFSVFQVSRTGGRERNEDRMGYCYTRQSALFVLADGMGGHPRGEVAAQIAVQTVSALFQRQARPALASPQDFLPAALLAAHRQILRYAQRHGMERDGPRTTLVAAVVQDGRACWVHCGDSRLYLVRGGQVLLRTRDHSHDELHKAGATGPTRRANRHMLFTCLGAPSTPLFDRAGPAPLQQGDRLLLCSDGLWSGLDEAAIASGLARQSVSHAVPALVGQALRAGGERCDNVTALALEWEAPGVLAPGPALATDAPDGQTFASTIACSPLDGLARGGDELGDEDLERAVAEINDAIRRAAARKG
ncbi:protein phosphatase 2C domain-containing protein [Melaminivora sp.]|uniref:PP2C family protein-serine/threonine phosphatase n=1 Tax=Melaminivora sp. TaxID=1933032 RepID=UPI0028A62C88|nr:protein phosphatase 2C domain-containing protein [Melaminivora sp.]